MGRIVRVTLFVVTAGGMISCPVRGQDLFRGDDLNGSKTNSSSLNAPSESYWKNSGFNAASRPVTRKKNRSGIDAISVSKSLNGQADDDQPISGIGNGALEFKGAEPTDSSQSDEADQESVRGPTLNNWPLRTIAEIQIDARDVHDQVPPDESDRLIQQFYRDWHDVGYCRRVFCWEAPNICYQPLYFEDVGLERYGQCRNEIWQSWLSAAHFFSSAALLPLHMRHDPIYGCEYPLGYCRPGNCTERVFQRQFWGLIR